MPRGKDFPRIAFGPPHHYADQWQPLALLAARRERPRRRAAEQTDEFASFH
jgi:hypothetical protein